MRNRRLILSLAATVIVSVGGLIALFVCGQMEKHRGETLERGNKAMQLRERWAKHVEPLPGKLKEHAEKILEANRQFPADLKPLPLEKVEEAERWLEAYRNEIIAAEKMLPDMERDAELYFEGEERIVFKELVQEARESIPVVKLRIDETLDFWARYRKEAGYKPR